MRRALVVVALVGCSSGRPAPSATIDAAPPPPVVDAAVTPTVVAPPAVVAHDFTAEARALTALALCEGDTDLPLPAGVRARHCARLAAVRERYRTTRLAPMQKFLAGVVPRDLPRTVVYPFAGGDLSTALTVFPDATEVTTLSLEPAGDPRTVTALAPAQRARALAVIADELQFLYVADFSDTIHLIGAMRGGELPTQLVFSLSALALHDCQLAYVRYFTLDADGRVVYLTDADVAAAPPPTTTDRDHRNRIFGDVEVGYTCAADPTVRVYRHLQANLDDEHLGADPRVVRYLEARGQVAAMTKAAAYLLGWPNFGEMRRYLGAHVVWMISDASGLPPRYAQAAGFVQEVWGQFVGAHIHAGADFDREWRGLFATSPQRSLRVPFGYRDRAGNPHLVVTRRP